MESSEHCVAVWNRMKRMRQIQMWKLCEGMTKAETELLHVMCRLSKKNPDIPVSQLPQVCCMQTSAISRLMKKMEADGLIVRKVDPNCRRNTLVFVNSAGAIGKKYRTSGNAFWRVHPKNILIRCYAFGMRSWTIWKP